MLCSSILSVFIDFGIISGGEASPMKKEIIRFPLAPALISKPILSSGSRELLRLKQGMPIRDPTQAPSTAPLIEG